MATAPSANTGRGSGVGRWMVPEFSDRRIPRGRLCADPSVAGTRRHPANGHGRCARRRDVARKKPRGSRNAACFAALPHTSAATTSGREHGSMTGLAGARSRRRWSQVFCLAQLALSVVEQGDWDEGARLVGRARAQVERFGLASYPSVALVPAICALVDAHRGRVEDARRELQRSIRLLHAVVDFPVLVRGRDRNRARARSYAPRRTRLRSTTHSPRRTRYSSSFPARPCSTHG